MLAYTLIRRLGVSTKVINSVLQDGISRESPSLEGKKEASVGLVGFWHEAPGQQGWLSTAAYFPRHQCCFACARRLGRATFSQGTKSTTGRSFQKPQSRDGQQQMHRDSYPFDKNVACIFFFINVDHSDCKHHCPLASAIFIMYLSLMLSAADVSYHIQKSHSNAIEPLRVRKSRKVNRVGVDCTSPSCWQRKGGKCPGVIIETAAGLLGKIICMQGTRHVLACACLLATKERPGRLHLNCCDTAIKSQDKDEVSGKGHEQPLTNGDKPVSPLKETDSARDINEQSLAGSTKDIGVPVESDQSPSAEKTAEDESPPAAEKASDAQAPPSPSTQDKEDQASPTLDPGDVQVVESPAGPAAQSIGTVQEEEDEAEVQVRGDQQGQIHQVQQQQHLHQHQQFQQRQQQQQQQPEASGEVSTASLISSAKPTSPGPSPAPSMASSLSTGMPYPSTSISNMLPPRATAAAILTGMGGKFGLMYGFGQFFVVQHACTCL
eukprot:scaffold63686_cov18-Tisochrysis_lutea.AAC.1